VRVAVSADAMLWMWLASMLLLLPPPLVRGAGDAAFTTICRDQSRAPGLQLQSLERCAPDTVSLHRPYFQRLQALGQRPPCPSPSAVRRHSTEAPRASAVSTPQTISSRRGVCSAAPPTLATTWSSTSATG
jgi:hypothetical protein